MIKPKRFFIYCNKLYWTYKWTYTRWINGYDGDADWHGYDEWMLAIGFEPALYRNEDWYYDGHTVKGYTILGIMIIKLYTYQAERLNDESGSTSP